MASMTDEYLFEVGKGYINPQEYTKLIYQYAAENNLSFETVVEDYIDFMQASALSVSVWTRLMAKLLGPSNRPVPTNRVTPVPPTFILGELRTLTKPRHDIFHFVLTDYVCGMLYPFGWIIPDAPYVYRVKRTKVFPTKEDLTDAIQALYLRSMLTSLAGADTKVIARTMKENKALQPALIATQLAYSAKLAYEKAKDKYASGRIVESVLCLLGRSWDPTTPKELRPTEYLARADGLDELKVDLSLFLAYQDAVRKNDDMQIHFSDLEMVSVIIPKFKEALAEVTPFRQRPITDVIPYLGKKTSKDHMGNPGRTVLFEDWEFDKEMLSFVTIQREASEYRERFIRVDSTVSEALTAALKPVGAVMSMGRLVDSRLSTYDLSASGDRIPKAGAELTLALPSIMEADYTLGVSSTDAITAIKEGVKTLEETTDNPATPSAVLSHSRLTARIYDYYAMLMHYAVAKSTNIGITSTKSDSGSGARNLFLIWRINTELKVPVGKAAISGSEVFTSEPLEAIMYAPDHDPTGKLSVKSLPLASHDEHLHLWDWRSVSEKLNLTATYMTSVRGKSYEVTMHEYHLLNIGARARRLRFMIPGVARAIAALWFTWFTEDQEFAQKAAQKSGDKLVKAAFEGREKINALALVRRLEQIGSIGIGAAAGRMIKQGLAEKMYGAGLIDDFHDIHVGIEKHRIAVWSGLTSLQLLGLMDAEEITAIKKYVVNSDALALMVAVADFRDEPTI
jgi:hypothetical protein